ncbi:hypothetical protein E3T43_01285 [Cryobacterium sp. Hh7]|uniref:hypothetical protein n=1 Tax=Cryobacterium sp. Hh7 TaxID=1259159 RepID=UPI00106BA5C4|nr:hypothetical protein [Cryobacterium sp. Hh7]TFD61131.1 hypothetical protein E3T43_01285 [Cryobacterium sp. Hh7]
MTSLSDKIAAAKAAPRDHLDVTVSLNKDMSEAVEALTAELATAKKSNDDRLGAPTAASIVQEKIDAVLSEAVDQLVTMRFTQLPGDEWRVLTQMCPPNPELILDRRLGYSVIDTCKLAAQYEDKAGRFYGHVVDGDELTVPIAHKVTKTNPDPTNEWQDMYSLMSGPEFTAIVDTIYALNVDAPIKRLNAVKNHSASLTA